MENKIIRKKINRLDWIIFKHRILALDKTDGNVLYAGTTLTTNETAIYGIYCTEAEYPLDLWASFITYNPTSLNDTENSEIQIHPITAEYLTELINDPTFKIEFPELDRIIKKIFDSPDI